MRVTCKHCGGPHPAFECRTKESTAARKDVPRRLPTAPERSGDARQSRVSDKGIETPPLATAGTQALPVDTIGPSPVDGSANIQKHTARFDPSDGPTKFDKKAWMREYMREHRRGFRRRSKETKLPLEGK